MTEDVAACHDDGKLLRHRSLLAERVSNEVRKLIAGPSVQRFCDECVELCNDIIREELEDRAEPCA